MHLPLQSRLKAFGESILSLWESVTVLCFVVRYFLSILVLQSSWWGRESWLLCLIFPPGVLWWLSGSSSRCHGVVCGWWLWYSLIIFTYYFCFENENIHSCIRTICVLWRFHFKWMELGLYLAQSVDLLSYLRFVFAKRWIGSYSGRHKNGNYIMKLPP